MAHTTQVAVEVPMALAPSSAFLLPSSAAPALRAGVLRGEASAAAEFSPQQTVSSAGVPLVAVVALGATAAATSRRRGQRAGKSSTVVRAFEDELGVQPPVGYWDPMGLAKDGDVGEFRRRREAELKNGRVAMFATMGYIVPEYYKFPGYLSPSADLKFADVPNGLAAIKAVPVEGWCQWLALCGFYELCVNVPKDPAEPGNYGRGRLGFTGVSIEDPAARKRSLNSELANGRLAMVAIMGMIFQNGFMGTTGPEMWSPAAASSTELRAGPKILEGTGGPFPNDCWDPAGLAKGKSDEQLLHWRAVELKHGRVCMLACLGWFHVAAGWHPIGDAAARMRVSDDPLVNVTQLPIGGAFQVVFTIMVLEWLTTYVIKPPADKPWDILGWKSVVYEEEPDWKDVQLQELNNGRLAMMGIIGLIAQDAYTGEYFAGIAKPCFGNIACADIDSWTGPFPTTPGAQPVIIP